MAQPIRDLRQLAFVPRGLRHAVSRAVGNPVRMASAPYRYLTAARRLEPQFAIIGGQKCGTTSLYAYLLQHPRVVSLFKEVHFFDNNYYKGRRWYRAQFPLAGAPSEDALITFDASPYYLFHPAAPQRVAALYPDMKLIALLRNPVDRAYSHYSHNRQSTAEKLSFEDAIRAEAAAGRRGNEAAQQRPCAQL
ncbi:MAG: sulfotransferase [Anaerolineae bacterium]